MAFIQPLDFQTIFADKFAGSAILFVLIALLIIGVMAARFRLPGGALVVVLVMFIFLFLTTYIAGTAILQVLFILILIGISYLIARAYRNGFG